MRLGCEVIGADANPLASGLLLPVIPQVTAPAGDPDYGNGLLRLCRDLRPDALMSTVEQELAQLLTMRAALDELGVRTWLPEPDAVDACADKAVVSRGLQTRQVHG